MVNGSRFYRAPESVSIASALTSALTIYPCQIRVHQRWESKLQLLTARKKEWWSATADSLPQAVICQLWIHTALAGIEPTTSRLLVRRATSCATVPPWPWKQKVASSKCISSIDTFDIQFSLLVYAYNNCLCYRFKTKIVVFALCAFNCITFLFFYSSRPTFIT